MSKKSVTIIVVGAIVLAVAGFAGGMLLGPRLGLGGTVAGVAGAPGAIGEGAGFRGGPMANLSDEERAKIEAMSDEERRTYFQEKMGGAAGGPGGRGARGGSIEGKVLDVADDSVTVQTTDGGSQTVYVSDETVLAYAEGVSAGELKAGDTIIAVTEPEADGVMSAKVVVVR